MLKAGPRVRGSIDFMNQEVFGFPPPPRRTKRRRIKAKRRRRKRRKSRYEPYNDWSFL